ncbi:hypothetical protein C0J52_21505 [Blattella germanica]|nr:hypothetical protein C0J52_21505 [Blattella germanica]
MKAGFTYGGIYNFHNCHIWADVNPNATHVLHHQQRFVESLGRTAQRQHNWPHFLPLHGQQYRRFLQTVLPDLLGHEDVPLNQNLNMWYKGEPKCRNYLGKYADGPNYYREWKRQTMRIERKDMAQEDDVLNVGDPETKQQECGASSVTVDMYRTFERHLCKVLYRKHISLEASCTIE